MGDPGEEPKGVDPRSTLPLTVTGRSIASLKRNIANLQDYIKENPDTTLPSLSYTLTARRIQHNYRVAFPLELRLFNTVDDAQNPDRLYELFAIVVHIGK